MQNIVYVIAFWTSQQSGQKLKKDDNLGSVSFFGFCFLFRVLGRDMSDMDSVFDAAIGII